VAEIGRKADSWRKTRLRAICTQTREFWQTPENHRQAWRCRDVRFGLPDEKEGQPPPVAEDRIFKRELKEHREGLEAVKINRSKNRPPT
jgi:hypothetical protein